MEESGKVPKQRRGTPGPKRLSPHPSPARNASGRGLRSRFESLGSQDDSKDSEEDGNGLPALPMDMLDVTVKQNGRCDHDNPGINDKESAAEEDVIDGFLILSFKTYQDLENEIHSAEESNATSDQELLSSQSLPDSDSESGHNDKKKKMRNRNCFRKSKMASDGRNSGDENAISREVFSERRMSGKHFFSNGEICRVGNNNCRTNGNGHFVLTPNKNMEMNSNSDFKYFPSDSIPRLPPEPVAQVILSKSDFQVCDTAKDDKEVLDGDSEITSRSASPKCEAIQAQGLKQVHPIKSPSFVPHTIQNGPLQQLEPSAAVAAVTVTTNTANPVTTPASSPHQPPACSPTPLPPSTSPAGAVLFPSALLPQEETPVPLTDAVSPVTSSISSTTSSSTAHVNYSYNIKATTEPHSNINNGTDTSRQPSLTQFSTTVASEFQAHQYSNSLESQHYNLLSENNRNICASSAHHTNGNTTHQYTNPGIQCPSYPNTTQPHPQYQYYSKVSNTSYNQQQYYFNKQNNSQKAHSYRQTNTTVNNNATNYINLSHTANTLNSSGKTHHQQISLNHNNNYIHHNTKQNEKNLITNCTEHFPTHTDKVKHSTYRTSYQNISAVSTHNKSDYYQQRIYGNVSKSKAHQQLQQQHQVNTNVTNDIQSTSNLPPVSKVDNYIYHLSSATTFSNRKSEAKHYSPNSVACSRSDSKKDLKLQPISGKNQWTYPTVQQSFGGADTNVTSDCNQQHYNSKSSKSNSYSSSLHNTSNTAYSNSVKSEQLPKVSNSCWTEFQEKLPYYNNSEGNTRSDNLQKLSKPVKDNCATEPNTLLGNSHFGNCNETYNSSHNFPCGNTTNSVQSHCYPVSVTSSNNNLHRSPSNSIKASCCDSSVVPSHSVGTVSQYPYPTNQKNITGYPSSGSVLANTDWNLPERTTNCFSQLPNLNSVSQHSEAVSIISPIVGATLPYPLSTVDIQPSGKRKSSPQARPVISHLPVSSTSSSSVETPSLSSVPFVPPDTSSNSSSSHSVFTCASVLTTTPPVTSVPYKGSGKPLWNTVATTVVSASCHNSRNITPVPSRDSNSNSSISSLSQLSQTFPAASGIPAKDPTRERASSASSSGRSCNSSRNTTPVVSSSGVAFTSSTTTGVCSTSTSTPYGTPGSLTSLVFSKPSCWTNPSTNTLSGAVSGSHLTPPLPQHLTPSPSGAALVPSLHTASHHNSPFGSHSAPHASLHSGGPHVMFAPPLPHSGSLSSSSLPIGANSGQSPFGGEALITPPNQDLLRRELDTRFLASQDRSINIPPPPYMRTEMHQHQHQHTHMHQHSPFLPPPLGSSLVPTTAHLYDKFPKIDSSFYGRSALGLQGYPTLSPLLAPGSAAAAGTPFAPPGHLAAFQPKVSSLVKTKNTKSGRWCAMHVRIAWEIYHHQQKQQQAESHKSGGAPTSAISSASKSPQDLLRPPNHLFASMPRPPDLPFSSSLLGAAASVHARNPYDVSPQHGAFLGPAPAHLGVSPFARPGYPGFGTPGSSFGGLGSLAGLTGTMFASRDMGPACLTPGQDPWSRLHRTPPNFSAPSVTSAASWGGLKAEAERERERLQREEQEKERDKNKKQDLEKEKRDKELEKSKEILRDKREQEKQKDRDRDNRVSHHAHNSEMLRNGEIGDRARDREREWERSRERQESSRSPMRTSRELLSKSDSAFESSNSTPKQEIKVKEEKKEDEHASGNRDNTIISSASSERERTKSSENSRSDSSNEFFSRSMPSSIGMGLNSLDRSRLMGPLGLAHPADRGQVQPFWGPLPPPPHHTSSATAATSLAAAEHYRNLELQHMRDLDREQLMQKYASLSSVMPLPPDRFRDIELARQLAASSEAAARDIDRQLQLDRDRQAYDRTKLPPPPLRPNDSPYATHPGLSSATVSGGLYSSLSNPFLNSLCGAGVPPRNKSCSPGNIGNGIPPPLIPCAGNSPSSAGTVQNHSTQHAHSTPSPLHHKLGSTPSAGVENSHEPYFSKERREVGNHPTEVDSQSR